MSLKRRRIQRSPNTTTWEIDALDAPRKANGRADSVTWARISPMMPPWLKTATQLPGVGGDDAVEGAADAGADRLGRLGAGDGVPALLAEHLQGDRVALGHVLAVELALPLAEVDLAQVALDDRLEPERAASGAAVCTVRRSVVT